MEPFSARNARILVVDDDPSSAEAVATLFREEGHEAVVAVSGAEATAALAGGGYGLVLLDPALRDRSGLELISYAKALGVPTIVTTSDPAFDPARTHYDGIGAFLYKPIRVPTLLGLITKALNPGRSA